MGCKKDGYGWVDPKDALPCPNLDDVPTRVVQLDWMEEARDGGKDYNGLDATALTTNRDICEAPQNNRTAQYIPSTGIRQTGEITSVWCPKDPLGLKEFLNRTRSFIAGHTLGLCFILCSAVLAVFAISVFLKPQEPHLKEASSAVPFKTSSVPAEIPDSNNAGEDFGLREEEQEEEIGPITPKAAANALINGELEEALRIYQRLAVNYPENESYALAVEVLLRGKRSGSK